MRGKSLVWMTFAALLLTSLAFSGVPVARAIVPCSLSVSPPTTGGPLYPPGSGFSIDIYIDCGDFGWLHAYEVKVRWDYKVLALNTPTEGPFLGKDGANTYFTYVPGVAGESVTIANLITSDNWVGGAGTLAHVSFWVVGGGETTIWLEEILLLDRYGNQMTDDEGNPLPQVVNNGRFWNLFPYIDWTWWVPTAVETCDPAPEVEVYGNGYYTTTDPDGDVDYHPSPEYQRMRPVIHLDDDTGAPTHGITDVEAGTMFYGDKIIFDASASYELLPDGVTKVSLPNAAFKWVIRAAAEDVYKTTTKTSGYFYQDPVTKKYWYDFRYETGPSGGTNPYTGELGPNSAIVPYTFPGKLSWVRSLYGLFLGWHDMTLTVSGTHGTLSIYTWIRIYRLCPARTVMVNIPHPVHSLSKDGDTMQFGGKVQNMGGTNFFIWESLTAYLELARMVHPLVLARIRFQIYKGSALYDTVYSDAFWLGPTENLKQPIYATWNLEGAPTGSYHVIATGQFCNSGVAFGYSATGAVSQSFRIVD